MTDSEQPTATGAPKGPGAADVPVPAPAPAAGAPLDPLIGRFVDDRYRIERRLARGGMATVYVAQDTRLERPVALKVMHPHLAESSDFVARFRREARSAARIVHPGVVSVHDQGVVDGQGFLVMELVDGTNLRALLQSEGAFTLARALRCTHDILDALRAAHRMGVVHRDIKPENVLVPHDGPMKVTDFGLARAASEVSMSTTGTMMGTVAYMAPEIAQSTITDPRSDLYAVGIMLYEMLTGEVPWNGASPIQMAYAHVHEDVPAPSARLDWLPTEVDELVAALTARPLDQRPADAGEALDLVARVRASLPPELAERRAEVAPHTGTEDATTAVMGTPGVTVTLPAPTQVVGPVAPVVHTSGDIATAPTATRPRRWVRVLAALVVLVIAAGSAGWWWWNEYGPGSYLDMPVTDGRSLTDVRHDLETMGLQVMVEESFHDTVPEGNVISTDPPSEGSVHKDATVHVLVSKGIEMKEVPDIGGKTQQEAATTLSDAGLTLGEVTQDWSEEVPADAVMSQSVPPGTQVPHDSPVDIVISKGRQPIAVPDVVGMTKDEATAAISALGLKPEATEAHSDTVEAGKVIDQKTQPETTLHKGDAVAFTVSLGPEMVEVPKIVGMNKDQAVAALQEAGFQVKVQTVLGGIFGTARYTDPDAGTRVRKGSTITLYVV